MPTGVTHILVPLLIISIIRDFYIKRKDKKNFPLHYALIAGIAGALPDFDIGAFWVLHFFGYTLEEVHRTWLHSLLVPLIFLILYLVFMKANVKAKVCNIGRHRLKLSLIFLMIAFGSLAHLILDGTLVGDIHPFYPLSNFEVGLNLFGYLPPALAGLAPASLDGIILIVYLLYLELKHKISDFI